MPTHDLTAPTPEMTLQRFWAHRDRKVALFLDRLLHSDRLEPEQRPHPAAFDQVEHLLVRMVSLCESDSYTPQAFSQLHRFLCDHWRRMPDLLVKGF